MARPTLSVKIVSHETPEFNAYMTALFNDWVWWKDRQLTTGDDVFDVTTHDAEACSICAPLVGPLFTRHPSPPCTCRYGLHPTIWCPTHRVYVPGVGMRSAAYTFRIDQRCEHHGDLRRAEDDL